MGLTQILDSRNDILISDDKVQETTLGESG